jgi:hypothetical protein
MKYLGLTLFYLLKILYFILERICKIVYIIICFLWDFKLLKDYSFWNEVSMPLLVCFIFPFYRSYIFKDYFENPYR